MEITGNIKAAVEQLRQNDQGSICRPALKVILTACTSSGQVKARASNGVGRKLAAALGSSRHQMGLAKRNREGFDETGRLKHWDTPHKGQYKNKVRGDSIFRELCSDNEITRRMPGQRNTAVVWMGGKDGQRMRVVLEKRVLECTPQEAFVRRWRRGGGGAGGPSPAASEEAEVAF
jgi:hypothetical protein